MRLSNLLRCIGCRCTNDRACPGGCSWASITPPICTACVTSGKVKLPAHEKCEGAPDGQHILLWLNPRSGYCEACSLPFIATEVA